MQNITVLGTGVLGSQIAFQAAYHGKSVLAYDLNDQILSKLASRWDYLKPLYLRDLPDATPEKLSAAVRRIRLTSDLAVALKEADLVVEAVPEVLEIKRAIWAKVGTLAPPKTVFATNSSTLLPGSIADATDRPEKFLALHFANEVWRQNTAEVMGHPGTDPQCLEAVAAFAEEIGMVAIRLKKEQPGYIVNSLLIPMLAEAAKLYVRDVADTATIDLTWRQSTGAPLGPFEIYDIIGMETPYQFNSRSQDPELKRFADILKRDFIDQGRLGRSVGKGFYDYG
ncbi:3-hydroxyacyl-CoA dehydrogenase [Arthrobacter sulfonylureivorans]|uniref:3-hydroxyacyl-CoA dehydrogenase n=1 Tax=Arthrobacter sulfonylureivorans TaxID=2486855 RepID=UPI0039E64D88